MASEVTGSSDSFAMTRWSMVLNAAQAGSPHWRDAMAELFLSYWKPLYAFCRRRGISQEQAHDLLQGFFTHLIERQTLRRAEQSRGRFRSFLLTCFRNFMSDQAEHDRAEKRGGSQPTISLNTADAEMHLASPAEEALSPERAFERRWALTVLEQAMATLRAEQIAAGNADRFRLFEPLLSNPGDRGDAGDLAADIGMTDNALRVALHRLRRRFREILRQQVSQTVSDPADVEEELRDLLAAVRAG
jgi:RNA polymerase sigma-70 factor (ECF subfamily)